MDLTFKGWIPTVSGALSFNFVGGARYPSATTYTNIADDSKRYVIAYQRRILLDCVAPMKEHLVRRFNYEGDFVFLCVSKCSNRITDIDDALCGGIYIFYQNEWGRTKKIVDQGIKQLNALRDLIDEESLETCFDADYKRLLSEMQTESIFFLDFKLKRNGVTTLSFTDQLSNNKLNFPDGSVGHKLKHIVCSQLFFFLKDIIHNHQHHQPTTDTLLDIHFIKDNDDFEWRCETLRFLYRKVLQFKREPSDELFSSSLGILAYIKTFKDISIKELESNSNANYLKYKSIFPDLCDNNLKDSIIAKQNSEKYKLAKITNGLDKTRNLILGLLGALFALVGLLRLTCYTFPLCDTSNLLIHIANFYLSHPIPGIGLIVTTVIAFMLYTEQIDLSESNIIIGVTRLLHSFNKNIAALILIIITFILFFVAFKLGIKPIM